MNKDYSPPPLSTNKEKNVQDAKEDLRVLRSYAITAET